MNVVPMWSVQLSDTVFRPVPAAWAGGATTAAVDGTVAVTYIVRLIDVSAAIAVQT
jgi:hypothetical protein